MSRDEATPQEEQYAALLAAFDDALAGGAPPPRPPTPPDTPPDRRPRLEDDLECLPLLHRLRPSECGVRNAECGMKDEDEPRPEAGELSSIPHSALRTPHSEERYTVIRLHAAGGIGQVW